MVKKGNANICKAPLQIYPLWSTKVHPPVPTFFPNFLTDCCLFNFSWKCCRHLQRNSSQLQRNLLRLSVVQTFHGNVNNRMEKTAEVVLVITGSLWCILITSKYSGCLMFLSCRVQGKDYISSLAICSVRTLPGKVSFPFMSSQTWCQNSSSFFVELNVYSFGWTLLMLPYIKNTGLCI